MNKKLIIFLSFLFSLVILLTLTFYFFPRNKNKDNNNSQEAFIQEENNEEKENEELNNKDENKEENEKNLNNSQKNKESKEEIEEPMKISNYFSILIIVFFAAIIFFSFIIGGDKKKYNCLVKCFGFLFIYIPFSIIYATSKIENFLPLGIVCRIYGFDKVIKKYEIKHNEKEEINDHEENSIEKSERKEQEEQIIDKIFERDCQHSNLFFRISNIFLGFFIKFLFLFLISLPFLVIANGLKNFKKKFRWKYLITSPFLFFRQGNLLMKITLILYVLWMFYDCYKMNNSEKIYEFAKYIFFKYAKNKLLLKELNLNDLKEINQKMEFY